MKKLLFINTLMLIAISMFFACQCKKNCCKSQTNTTDEATNTSASKTSNTNKRIEHGTVNPSQLDSIKLSKQKGKK